MAESIFHRSLGRGGGTTFSYNPTGRLINYATRMYNKKTTMTEMREVTISEEEWIELIKYGEEAGFYCSR
jgi:hypothetical protein